MSSKILNPRLVKIYELLRGFGLSANQAMILAKKTFNEMPSECQVASQHEIEEQENSRN